VSVEVSVGLKATDELPLTLIASSQPWYTKNYGTQESVVSSVKDIDNHYLIVSLGARLEGLLAPEDLS
jgi:ribosomal protein S1